MDQGTTVAPGRARSLTARVPLSAARAELLVQLGTVFLAYFLAGKLGQATSSIRSSNLGPVWPAYGIALASLLAYGSRVWPALAASAFVVALQGSVSPLAAAGQAAGATLAAATGARLLRGIPDFDPALTRLRDALGLIVLGGFGSALVSSLIGASALYATGIQAYSGLASAWFIYWLGDATGVLLVTPIVFTLSRFVRALTWPRVRELALLLVLLTLACLLVFGDWPFFPVRLHALAFAVLPFVMWGAIGFGIAGAALSVAWIAGIATVLTALGHGPFAANTTLVNAVLLDVLFIVLSLSGLSLAAVIAERERAQAEQRSREALSEVNRRLIDAQEQERARIARELHDDISQRLSLLAFDINAGATGSDPARLRAEVAQIAADVQSLSHRLHSAKLDLLGLAKAAQALCREFAAQQKMPVRFTDKGAPPDLPVAASLCLYRILQEALHNASKHSGAREIDVELGAAASEVYLTIVDRGRGFDVGAAKQSHGIGLVSMQERVALVGGRLSIESAPNRGTTINARVPIEQP